MILLLNILKIIGIILLCILGLILLLAGLVLFVPIRYRLKAEKKADVEEILKADVKATWLLHFISATFRYPEQAYLKIRVLGISVFSTEDKSSGTTEKSAEKDNNDAKTVKPVQKTEKKVAQHLSPDGQAGADGRAQAGGQSGADSQSKEQADKQPNNRQFSEENLEKKAQEEPEDPTIIKFFRKLWEKLKNIKYTISEIYDKIKQVVKNIRYYLAVIQSNCFQRAFAVCKDEAFSLLKSIRPRKIVGNFTIGTGDPASTAQILAIHGMLYPLIGNHINITPDFDDSIMEGDFFLKGKITIFKVLKTAIKVYFNKDLRKVMRLLKREAA